LTSFTRAFTAAHGLAPAAFRARGVQIVNELRTNTDGASVYPVTIEDLAPMRAAGVLHQGPYADIGRAFQRLGAILAAHNLFAAVDEIFVVYHDAPGSKPEADMRAHVAVVIANGFPPELEGLDYFDLQ
ncbi:GyrI-like domain-containing protein, partial [Rhizobiaceae sp. 2RAB30]